MKKLKLWLVVACGALIGTSALADQMSGTYEGYNNFWRATVRLVLDNGKASVTTYKPNQTNRINGSYGNGWLKFGGANYTANVEQDGIRVVQNGNARNNAFYSRLGNFNLGGGHGGVSNSGNAGGFQGTYTGFRDKDLSDWNLVINRNGSVHIESRPRDGSGGKTLDGTFQYKDRIIKLSQTRYHVIDMVTGIRIINENDLEDAFVLAQVSGGGNVGGGGNSPGNNTPPSWLVGTFSGHSAYNKADIFLTVQSGGRADAEYVTSRGRDKRSGRYQNNRLVLDKMTFDVSQIPGGVRMRQLGNSSNMVDLRGGGENNGFVPTWAVGTFSGMNVFAHAQYTLTISGNGNVSAEIGGRHVSGEYRNARVSLGSEIFDVVRTNNGLRITNVDNRSNHADLVKNGSTESGAGVPSWLVGRFLGASNDMTVSLTVRGDGSAMADFSKGGKKPDHRTGSYKAGYLTLKGATYNVIQIDANNIRLRRMLVQSDVINLKRQ